MAKFTAITVTIPSGASGLQTGFIELEGGAELVALHMPAAWIAAAITFDASAVRAGTENGVFDSDGAELSLSAAINRAISLTPIERDLVSAHPYVRVRSGTEAVPVDQTATRTIIAIVRHRT